MDVIRHQRVGVYLEVIIVRGSIEAVVKVLVILILLKNSLPVTPLQDYMLGVIDDRVAR
jgi:hypothetical protein